MLASQGTAAYRPATFLDDDAPVCAILREVDDELVQAAREMRTNRFRSSTLSAAVPPSAAQ
eukprot:3204896-Pleurochrysis_carterae.AAC.1